MDPRQPGEVQATGTLPISGEGTLPQPAASAERTRPDWIAEARANLTVAGKYLAYDESGRRVVVPVSREWTRIGRSLAADIRFDDATVSRRHALVANEETGVRVLDDRSLNGIQVNGRRVEWSPLVDGDELSIGRHVLYFLDTLSVPASAGIATPSIAE